MARHFRLRCVSRRRLIWLVSLLLLWQQVALAAYACQVAPETIGQMTATTAVSMNSMDGDCPDMRGSPSNPLCQKHCAPDHATQVDVRPTSVPLSALTAVPPMLMSVAIVSLQSDRFLARLDPRRTLPFVPRLLFCSLLI
ncbi:MAG: hypothetical protein ABI767_00470 [Rhodanobacter sp.]